MLVYKKWQITGMCLTSLSSASYHLIENGDVETIWYVKHDSSFGDSHFIFDPPK